MKRNYRACDSISQKLNESLSGAKMSGWLLFEADDNDDISSRVTVVKSLLQIANRFKAHRMDKTEEMFRRANSVIGKQIGALKSRKQSEIRDFNMLYGAMMTFLVALDSFMDSIAITIDAQDSGDNEIIDSVLDGGIDKQLDMFVPSKKSEMFPKLVRWYQDMEKLGSLTHESITNNEEVMNEGPAHAIVGAIKSLLGFSNVPKTKEATAKNLVPLFKGNILNALRSDFSVMTVGEFNKVRKEIVPLLKNSIGSASSRNNPITSPAVAEISKQIELGSEALSNKEVLNAILTVINGMKDKKAAETLSAGINKIAEDPTLIDKVKEGTPIGDAANAVIAVAGNAAKEDKIPQENEIKKAIEPVEVEEKEKSEKEGASAIDQSISSLKLKDILKKEEDENDDEYDGRLDAIAKAIGETGYGITLSSKLSKKLSPEASNSLTSAVREILKGKVVKESSLHHPDESNALEKWQRMAGIK